MKSCCLLNLWSSGSSIPWRRELKLYRLLFWTAFTLQQGERTRRPREKTSQSKRDRESIKLRLVVLQRRKRGGMKKRWLIPLVSAKTTAATPPQLHFSIHRHAKHAKWHSTYITAATTDQARFPFLPLIVFFTFTSNPKLFFSCFTRFILHKDFTRINVFLFLHIAAKTKVYYIFVFF